jgi:hypothetical protein
MVPPDRAGQSRPMTIEASPARAVQGGLAVAGVAAFAAWWR